MQSRTAAITYSHVQWVPPSLSLSLYILSLIIIINTTTRTEYWRRVVVYWPVYVLCITYTNTIVYWITLGGVVLSHILRYFFPTLSGQFSSKFWLDLIWRVLYMYIDNDQLFWITRSKFGGFHRWKYIVELYYESCRHDNLFLSIFYPSYIVMIIYYYVHEHVRLLTSTTDCSTRAVNITVSNNNSTF